jgi:hypothetical protein
LSFFLGKYFPREQLLAVMNFCFVLKIAFAEELLLLYFNNFLFEKKNPFVGYPKNRATAAAR